MKKNLGFTLFELLVTIAVISILSVISVPTFMDMSSRQQLNKTTSDLKWVLQRAQTKAALEGRTITVNVGTQPAAPTVGTMNWVPSGNAVLVGSASTIYFNPNGYVQTSSTNTAYAGVKTFKICDSANAATKFSRTLKINRIGVISDSGVVGGCS